MYNEDHLCPCGLWNLTDLVSEVLIDQRGVGLDLFITDTKIRSAAFVVMVKVV